MKTIFILVSIVSLLTAKGFNDTKYTLTHPPNRQVELKENAYNILERKCNVCHKKENPFMVFSLKNMDRRASKIQKQVFIKKRMPKGGTIKLTDAEYTVLQNWINSKNLK